MIAMMRLRQTTLIVFTIAQCSLAVAPTMAARNEFQRLSRAAERKRNALFCRRLRRPLVPVAAVFANSRELPLGFVSNGRNTDPPGRVDQRQIGRNCD